jgi:hypothetical protein
MVESNRAWARIHAARASGDQSHPHELGEDAVRLLALLQDKSGALNVPELRERGIDAPAQAIYMPQLVGYQVDRIPVRLKDGRQSMGYRIQGGSPPAERAVCRQREGSADEPWVGAERARGSGDSSICRSRTPTRVS